MVPQQWLDLSSAASVQGFYPEGRKGKGSESPMGSGDYSGVPRQGLRLGQTGSLSRTS